MSKGERVFLYAFIAVIFSSSAGFSQTFTDQTATLAPGLDDWVDGNTAKVAWGDYNSDGYVDFLAGGELWKNNAGASFTVVKDFGEAQVLWADSNNDGKLDVYNYGPHVLYRSLSTPTTTSFVSVSMPELPGNGASRGASWADFNNNGYVDLYVGGYEPRPNGPGLPDDVIHNNGDGTFSYSASADQYNISGNARGVTSCDWDRDGDQDVYVSNYRLQANRLLQNNGSGSFTDVAGTYNARAGNGHSMGAAWGDFNNDGKFDLFAGNFSHPGQPQSRFLENTMTVPGTPTAFADRGNGGVTWVEAYASPALGDYDNDGHLDLFFAVTPGYGNHPRLYRNDGSGNFSFTNVTSAAFGSSAPADSMMAGWADFDNDGDLDLVTDGRLYVNNTSQTTTHHWLKVNLIGGQGEFGLINRSAIGAQVRIDVPGLGSITRQVEGGTGEGNQNDLTLHFGLGSYSGTVDLDIAWPDGTQQTVSGVAVDQVTSIRRRTK
jgi:hypothetical protein